MSNPRRSAGITKLTTGMHSQTPHPFREDAHEAHTVRMTSFINTMFVHNSLPQPYNQSPRPLPALHSNILAESESCSSMQYPSSPEAAYTSPLQRHIQETYFYDSKHGTSNIPVPVHVGNRTHDVHRGHQHPGLGNGLGDIGRKADLLTFNSNANARTRNQAFQPQKRAKGTNSWQLKQFAEATLGSGSLRRWCNCRRAKTGMNGWL